MPVPTADQRIKQIVDQTKGNRAQAERLIREQIDRDPQFLRQLVEPHLRGIIAHALSRAPAPEQPAKPLSDNAMDALMQGLQNSQVTAKPSGQGHADTMRAIADAHRRARDKS